MNKLLKIAVLGLVSITLFTACGKKNNEEELKRLNEAKAATEASEIKLKQLKKERMALENDLSAREKELESLKKEKSKLKKK